VPRGNFSVGTAGAGFVGDDGNATTTPNAAILFGQSKVPVGIELRQLIVRDRTTTASGKCRSSFR
jgi:hypothetical protein